jgi:hypothetical protein
MSMDTRKMAAASTRDGPLQPPSLPDADDEQGVHELMIRTLLEAGERLRLPQVGTMTILEDGLPCGLYVGTDRMEV